MPFLDRIHRELNIPCLYVSHDLSEILQLSDQIVLMKNGRIADHGKLDQIIQHEELRELIHERDLNQIISQKVATCVKPQESNSRERYRGIET